MYLAFVQALGCCCVTHFNVLRFTGQFIFQHLMLKFKNKSAYFLQALVLNLFLQSYVAKPFSLLGNITYSPVESSVATDAASVFSIAGSPVEIKLTRSLFNRSLCV